MDQIARTSGHIGAALKRRRRSLDMSQGALGEKISLRQATISSLESGDRGTRLSTLLDAMAALGLELVIRPRTRSRTDDGEDIL